MRRFFLFKQMVLIVAVMGLAACNAKLEADGTKGLPPGPEKPINYRTEAAAGLINSQDWVFLSGTAKRNYYDQNRLSLNLYNQLFSDPCSGFNYGSRNVLASVPAAIGETVLGQNPDFQTVTFTYRATDGSSSNLIAYEGRLAVTEITKDFISGFIIAQYDSVNYINGSYKLKFCER